MQRADIAMYSAKHRSLGVASYDEGADSHTPERLALLGDLRRALSSDELFLLYQPKVNLRTGEVCGAEALIRWRHPERGIVSPDEFIPLAENTGLIGPLTTYVLDLALAQARRWVDQDAGIQVAVNLSARNLLDEKLDENVAELLAWHGIDPSLLKLEITESAVMTDPTRAAEVLERLAAQGIAISIDDFGAGYTSIRQLRDLPISELKVDRSFVTAMEDDPSNSTIVRSVIELGHNLGMTAVAEGIESLETLKCLTGYACDVAQGYYLSRPLLAEDFDVWRARWAGLPGLPVQPGNLADGAIVTSDSGSR
jgi:EAL domain-containing protein (putative c-di-GMP-specific phosphodiesterase class I)